MSTASTGDAVTGEWTHSQTGWQPGKGQPPAGPHSLQATPSLFSLKPCVVSSDCYQAAAVHVAWSGPAQICWQRMAGAPNDGEPMATAYTTETRMKLMMHSQPNS